MKFGVFIRSTGERTERLCIDSCCKGILREDIHLIKNYYPSYKAFKRMFQLAKKYNYDWYLGLDADIILREDWINLVKERIEAIDVNNVFRFQFYVYDKITCSKLVRGNNFYNHKFTDTSYKYLKQNVSVGKLWFYYKHKNVSSGYFTKPETSIRTRMKDKLKINDVIFEDVIGWHAFEQYNVDIFREFEVRYHRDPTFVTKYHFLEEMFLNQDISNYSDRDYFIAKLGWDYGKRKNLIKSVNSGKNNEYSSYLKKVGIKEKEKKTFSLREFYSEYRRYLDDE